MIIANKEPFQGVFALVLLWTFRVTAKEPVQNSKLIIGIENLKMSLILFPMKVITDKIIIIKDKLTIPSPAILNTANITI